MAESPGDRPKGCSGRSSTAESRLVRLLITGGAGFIGSAFTRHVLSDDYPDLAGAEVVVLDKLTYAGNLANLEPVANSSRYTFVQGDICDPELVEDLIAQADAVVHFAAESHVDRSIMGGADFVVTNVLGTQTLLHAALRTKLQRFVHISTDEVYGSIETGSWDESCPLLPNSPYSAAKASSDLMARAYQRTHGVPVVITRCSNNYGPYQFPEKVIPLFVTNLLDGLTVPLYGAGANVRDWLHVDDHCRGIASVLTGGRPGEIYNIGGGTELTNAELTERLIEATGRDESFIERIVDPRGGGHDLRYSVDISKINRELGYEPQVSFEQGLADTIAWYTDNRDWWEPLKARSAIDR